MIIIKHLTIKEVEIYKEAINTFNKEDVFKARAINGKEGVVLVINRDKNYNEIKEDLKKIEKVAEDLIEKEEISEDYDSR